MEVFVALVVVVAAAVVVAARAAAALEDAAYSGILLLLLLDVPFIRCGGVVTEVISGDSTWEHISIS